MTPEFRRDPLHHTWVVFAPKRQRRPQDYGPAVLQAGHVDPFAAGNERLTPREVFAIRDEPTAAQRTGLARARRAQPLSRDGNRGPAGGQSRVGLYDHLSGIGAHEVVIETPDGDRALEDLPVPAIAEVLAAWRERINDLDRDLRFQHIYIFKNVGPAAGASLAHAHSQIVALPVIPPLVEGKLIRARAAFRAQAAQPLQRHPPHRARGRLAPRGGERQLLPLLPLRQPLSVRAGDLPQAASSRLRLVRRARAARPRRGAPLRARSGSTTCCEKPGYNLLLHTAPLRRRATERFASSRDDYCWHVEITPRFNSLAGFEVGLGSYINTVFPEEAARYLRGEAKT